VVQADFLRHVRILDCAGCVCTLMDRIFIPAAGLNHYFHNPAKTKHIGMR
jgi:hypothetical protein